MTPACDSIRRARPLLGTFVEVAATGAARACVSAAVESAFEAIAQVHRLMSVHEPGSDVGRLNRSAAAKPLAVHPWTYGVLEAALELYRRSGGVFDVAVAPALEALGLLPRHSAKEAPAAIDGRGSGAIELLPGHRVRFHDTGVRIDLGGIAKGFAVDRAIEAMQRHGMSQGLVNAGGDVALFGPEVQTIHLRDPRHPGRVLGRVSVKDGALASTGGRFDPFRAPHPGGLAVIDPKRGQPVDEIAGASVRASSGMIADALTKLVVISGESAIALLDYYGASALFVSGDGGFHVTSGWPEAMRRAA